jgi:hypothetical protein
LAAVRPPILDKSGRKPAENFFFIKYMVCCMKFCSLWAIVFLKLADNSWWDLATEESGP